jgi:hypothetical protein
MGVIVPEGMAQVAMSWSCTGNTSEKIMTIGINPDFSGGDDPTEIADRIYSGMVGSAAPVFASNMFDEWTFNGVSASLMTSTGPLVGQHIDPIPGTLSGMGVPLNSAVLLKKNTGLGGRKQRGRMYWPPTGLASANVTTAGEINSTLVGIFVDNWIEAFSNWLDNDCVPMLFHSDATAATPITGLTVESVLATQRRRMR